MARLVEVAAHNFYLKKIGHYPARDFTDRLIAFMSSQAEQTQPKVKPIIRDTRHTEA